MRAAKYLKRDSRQERITTQQRSVIGSICEAAVRIPSCEVAHWKNETSTAAENRKKSLRELTEVLERCPASILIDEKIPNSGRVRLRHDEYVGLLTKSINKLRKNTINVLENLREWRHLTRHCNSTDANIPFSWEGVPLMSSMKTDIQSISNNPIAVKLIKEEVLNNTLLYPTKLNGITNPSIKQLRISQARETLIYEESFIVGSDASDVSLTDEDLLLDFNSSESVDADLHNTSGPYHPTAELSVTDPLSPRTFISDIDVCTPSDISQTFTKELIDGGSPLSVFSDEILNTNARTIQLWYKNILENQKSHPVGIDQDSEINTSMTIQVRSSPVQHVADDSTVFDEEMSAPIWWGRVGVRYTNCNWRDSAVQENAAASAIQLTFSGKKDSCELLADRRALLQQKRSIEVISMHYKEFKEKRENRRVASKKRDNRIHLRNEVAIYENKIKTIIRVMAAYRCRLSLYRRLIDRFQEKCCIAVTQLSRVVRGIAGRKLARKLKTQVIADRNALLQNQFRKAAATRLQAAFRGASCRKKLSNGHSRQLDVSFAHNKSAILIVRAFRVKLAKVTAARLRAIKQKERKLKQQEELKTQSQIRIYWWYIGRKAAKTVQNRINKRHTNRLKHTTRVAERYRGVICANNYLATLADESNKCWLFINSDLNKNFFNKTRESYLEQPLRFISPTRRHSPPLAECVQGPHPTDADTQKDELNNEVGSSCDHHSQRSIPERPESKLGFYNVNENQVTNNEETFTVLCKEALFDLDVQSSKELSDDDQLVLTNATVPLELNPKRSCNHMTGLPQSPSNYLKQTNSSQIDTASPVHNCSADGRSPSGSEKSDIKSGYCYEEESIHQSDNYNVNLYLRHRHKQLHTSVIAILQALVCLANIKVPSSCVEIITLLIGCGLNEKQSVVPTLRVCDIPRCSSECWHVLCNNLLWFNSDLLREMMINTYGGTDAAEIPKIYSSWRVSIVLSKIIVDWGLHSMITCFDKITVSEDITILQCLLSELRLSSTAQLINLCRPDPSYLFCCEDLSLSLGETIFQSFPQTQDNWLSWIHEMGILQVLSVQPATVVDEMSACLPFKLPEDITDDSKHAVISRFIAVHQNPC